MFPEYDDDNPIPEPPLLGEIEYGDGVTVGFVSNAMDLLRLESIFLGPVIIVNSSYVVIVVIQSMGDDDE